MASTRRCPTCCIGGRSGPMSDPQGRLYRHGEELSVSVNSRPSGGRGLAWIARSPDGDIIGHCWSGRFCAVAIPDWRGRRPGALNSRSRTRPRCCGSHRRQRRAPSRSTTIRVAKTTHTPRLATTRSTTPALVSGGAQRRFSLGAPSGSGGPRAKSPDARQRRGPAPRPRPSGAGPAPPRCGRRSRWLGLFSARSRLGSQRQ